MSGEIANGQFFRINGEKIASKWTFLSSAKKYFYPESWVSSNNMTNGGNNNAIRFQK